MSQVKSETEVRSPDDQSKHSADMVRDAAFVLKPALAKHVGTFVLHVYQHGSAIQTSQFTFATQFVGDVPESLAIEAAKELKHQMMARYGHNIPKR